jgi:hypothetical protein
MIQDLRQLMQDYTAGAAAPDEAAARFAVLQAQFEAFPPAVDTDSAHDQLRTFCHHHNTGNFSILSGIYLYREGELRRISAEGTPELQIKVENLLAGRIPSLIRGKALKVIPAAENGLRNTLYVYPALYSHDSMLFAVCLSSSPFFSEPQFLSFGRHVSGLVPQLSVESYTCLEIYRQIEDYIAGQATPRTPLVGMVYAFSSLQKIFSHMGLHNLFELADDINRQLRHSTGGIARIYSLSLNEYALFYPEQDYTHGLAAKKQDFVFRGIHLPYASKEVRLTSADGFYLFLDTLFSLIMH